MLLTFHSVQNMNISFNYWTVNKILIFLYYLDNLIYKYFKIARELYKIFNWFMNAFLKKTYTQLNNSQIFVLIVVLVAARLIPHPPNFTPIIAAAIIAGAIFRNFYLAIFSLFLSMFISDLYLGFHSTIFYTYFSLFVVVFVFSTKLQKINVKNTLVYGLIGSTIFFIISNFGVWLSGELYSKDLEGLIECYYLAIPFFGNTLFSTIFFSYLGLLAALIISRSNLKIEQDIWFQNKFNFLKFVIRYIRIC